MITENIFFIMNIIGLLAFAVVGSLKGIKKGLDLLGITVLGIMTALGGGITRDLLVNTIPYALMYPNDIIVSLIGVWLAIVVFKVFNEDISNKYIIQIPDAIGLSAFTTTGAMIAFNFEVSFFGVIILATLTGVGGGIISDILLQKTPSALTEDFYASCSIIGAVSFYLCILSNVNFEISAVICSIIVLMVRIVAILCKWSLPKFYSEK
ncbi:protein of unknown function UPF0126 [Methanococcus vannielii SB]|uniref:Glycine transporter domain-containing protein n=1 Tax=Methanococcus vannielii (strain ATCC 35089 / DSM 1224 / JCM 13029 / OCM 148 / SB) TaxID=406327 RepID=A6URY4_METVS|nr:trimeric intracellular cation channel family protein [Methanococcus vannielii]ABR55256.1 protein of unknown function UPF0126 [Methanococcus vannielii SB]